MHAQRMKIIIFLFLFYVSHTTTLEKYKAHA